MTRQEFEARTQVRVEATEFEAINTVYMNSDVDKDTFCKAWCMMNVSRVKAAKEARERQEAVDNVLSMMLENPEWSDVEHYNTPAFGFLSDKETCLLESIGISLEEDVNDDGSRHLKSFGKLRNELRTFLKSA